MLVKLTSNGNRSRICAPSELPWGLKDKQESKFQDRVTKYLDNNEIEYLL